MRKIAAGLGLVVVGTLTASGCAAILGIDQQTQDEEGGSDSANGESPGSNDALSGSDAPVPIGDSALTDTTSSADARTNSDATVTETGSDGAGMEAGTRMDAQMDGGSSQEAAPDAATVDANYPYELVDDMQANSGQIAIKNGRNGYWFTYNDGTDGGVETPASGGTFTDSMITPARSVTGVFASIIGATTSTYAAEATGSGFDKVGGMGFNFKNPRAAYNASAYTGFVFWGRIGSSTTAATIRFLVSDAHTDSQGGTCSMCSDYLAMDLTFTTTWQQFTVNYSDLSQAGFGVPAETTLDAAAVYGVQFQVSTTAPAGQAFDVWIDDIYFIKP